MNIEELIKKLSELHPFTVVTMFNADINQILPVDRMFIGYETVELFASGDE